MTTKTISEVLDILIELADEHFPKGISKERGEAMVMVALAIPRLETLITEARIDTVKVIKENTEYALNNDTQVVEIFRDKDNKVTSITNTICENYLTELKEQS